MCNVSCLYLICPSEAVSALHVIGQNQHDIIRTVSVPAACDKRLPLGQKISNERGHAKVLESRWAAGRPR